MATTAGTFGWRGGRRSGGESVGGSLGTDGAISGGRLPPTECRAIKSFSHVHVFLIQILSVSDWEEPVHVRFVFKNKFPAFHISIHLELMNLTF